MLLEMLRMVVCAMCVFRMRARVHVCTCVRARATSLTKQASCVSGLLDSTTGAFLRSILASALVSL